MSRKTIWQMSIVALAVLTLLAAVSPVAVAKRKSKKADDPVAAVVGHLTLPAPASHLLSAEDNRRHYLLIDQDSKEGFIIVDVTEPSQPTIVKHVAWPNQASNGKVRLVTASLALSSAPENAGTASAPAQSMNLLDLRDPANPKAIKGFSGVTSMLTDESRSLMYVTNAEGLWVVKYKPQDDPISNPFGCPTDGSTTVDPNCSN
jgi:hypothetical protein